MHDARFGRVYCSTITVLVLVILTPSLASALWSFA
jgi:hypothetical protein